MKATIDENLAASVVDALTSNICVVDLTGEILSVNRAWMEFSTGNGGGAQQDYIGKNYLNVCQSSTGPASEEAPGLYDGLQDVLEGRTDIFDIEYPCHSPTERRWFLARVTPLIRKRGAKDAQQVGAVVSHMNITDRKLIELDYAKLASTDSLTDLPNRRFFEQYAKIELERLRRFGGNMSVLMMDLDNFKLINDRHGHLAGDVVLKKVAAGCKAAFRGSDLFARIGGEEFVALLLGTDEAGAILQAEKLRAIVENLLIKTESATFRVTISIGVALVAPKDRSINSSLSRADKALYAAKSAGRNRVHASANGHGFVSS